MHRGFADGGAGFLDAVRAEPARLLVSGWLLLDDGPPDVVEAVGADGGTHGGRVGSLARISQQLTRAFPVQVKAGSTSRCLRATSPRHGDYAFTLRALRDDQEAFACPAVRRDADHRTADHHPTLGEDGVLRL